MGGFRGGRPGRRDEFLAEFSADDLEALKQDVGKNIAFESEGARDLFLSLKNSHGWVREEVYRYVTRGEVKGVSRG